MRFLNYRAWQDNPEKVDADPDDFEDVDDDETEAEYRRAAGEAVQMVREWA